MPTPLEEVLLDAKGMRDLGYTVPTDDQFREREDEINKLREGGMKIYEITNHIQSSIIMGGIDVRS